MDKITPLQRSLNMSKIRSRNTTPELAVRKVLTQLGYRYRINVKSLPGKPDISLGRIKTVIFIHGCFWHQHEGCKRNFMPKSNLDYWKNKLKNNVTRFERHKTALIKSNYNVIVIWECETKNIKQLKETIENQLGANAVFVEDGHK